MPINTIREDEERGYLRKHKKHCPNCKTHFRSENEIEHDCPFCNEELIEEAEHDNERN